MRRRHTELGFAGSIHFITTVTHARGQVFVEPNECRSILTWFEGYRAKYELLCYGYVLMPDHLHAILFQTDAGTQVSDAIGGFKRMTSLRCRPTRYPNVPLWRSNFDDVPVPGTKAVGTKLEYMLGNPVRAGLVVKPEDYLWSSAPEYFGIGKGTVSVTLLTA